MLDKDKRAAWALFEMLWNETLDKLGWYFTRRVSLVFGKLGKRRKKCLGSLKALKEQGGSRDVKIGR